MSLSSKLISTSLILGLNVMALTANAQSHDFASDQFRQDREARVSLKIPFGTERKDSKAMPRLAFSVRDYQPTANFNNSWALKPNSSTAQFGFIENEIAISLDQSQQLSVNGQTIYIMSPEDAQLSDDVKTAGKIALGAGLIVVAVIAVTFGVYIVAIATSDEPLDGG